MEIYDVFDPEFRDYGKVIENLDVDELVGRMEKIPFRGENVSYEPSIACLEECAVFHDLENRVYGGMPIQIGMCWGHNTKLNCLEYHRDSEINIGTSEFVLLLAKEGEIENGKIDTAMVKAFRVPAALAVEVFATSLHYAPCGIGRDAGFRVAIVLPKGTNTELPAFEPRSSEDRLMTARNKWLLAHKDSAEAACGATVALEGDNIDIADFI